MPVLFLLIYLYAATYDFEGLRSNENKCSFHFHNNLLNKKIQTARIILYTGSAAVFQKNDL